MSKWLCEYAIKEHLPGAVAHLLADVLRLPGHQDYLHGRVDDILALQASHLAGEFDSEHFGHLIVSENDIEAGRCLFHQFQGLHAIEGFLDFHYLKFEE